MGNQHNEDTQNVTEAARDEKLQELEILQQSLEEKKKQAGDYYDQLLRLKAEFDNFRRRTEKEKQNYLLWGKEEILRKQIMLLDVLEQAEESTRTSSNIESIRKGVELIHREFVKMIRGEGLAEIESQGRKFDPCLHEAVDYAESDQPEGTIIQVLQKGYLLDDRVVRPARVKVARNPQQAAGTGNTGEEKQSEGQQQQ